MIAGMESKPWYRQKASRRHRLIASLVFIPGMVLALLAEPIALRAAGLALAWAGVALHFYGQYRAER
jgi:hypothetical protein